MRIDPRLVRTSARCALAWVVLSPASASALNEFQKLTPGDPSVNDNFAYSVGISGTTAILGAWKDDRPGMLGDDSGSAYIFSDNGTGNWVQIDKLTAADAASGNNFGSAVAVDGNTAAVGAMLKGSRGGAYIFQDNGAGDWVEIDTLAADDGMIGDEFGYSIALSGNTAIVGAWQSGALRGAAYVFRDNGAGDWAQIAKLTADDAMPGDRFGVSVAISGNTALVGAHFDTNMAGPLAGAVYVFQENGGTWSQVDKLIASDAAFNNQFGRSITLNGDTAVIGAPGDSAGGVEAGAAYIFRRDASLEFQEVTKLLADDPGPSNLFGYSVGLSGNTAVVGAYQDSDSGLASGSSYFFKENALGSWQQVAKLLASDGAAGDAFGYSVAISNGIGLIGAPLSNTGGTDTGAAYLFNAPTRIAGDYNQNGTVDAADYVVWRQLAGQSGAGLAADGNGDGTVNQIDHDLWQANFGLSTSAEAATLQPAALPEPAAATLGLGALAFVLLWRGARRNHLL